MGSYMKKIFTLILSSLILTCSLQAQSADRVTDVINSERVTFGQACYFFATATGKVEDNIAYDDSIKFFQDSGSLRVLADENDPITLGTIAQLASDAFEVKGSLFLALFGNSRYAYRQMKADGVFKNNDDPSFVPDGHKFLAILTDCLEFYKVRESE